MAWFENAVQSSVDDGTWQLSTPLPLCATDFATRLGLSRLHQPSRPHANMLTTLHQTLSPQHDSVSVNLQPKVSGPYTLSSSFTKLPGDIQTFSFHLGRHEVRRLFDMMLNAAFAKSERRTSIVSEDHISEEGLKLHTM